MCIRAERLKGIGRVEEEGWRTSTDEDGGAIDGQQDGDPVLDCGEASARRVEGWLARWRRVPSCSGTPAFCERAKGMTGTI